MTFRQSASKITDMNATKRKPPSPSIELCVTIRDAVDQLAEQGIVLGYWHILGMVNAGVLDSRWRGKKKVLTPKGVGQLLEFIRRKQEAG